MPWLVAFPTVGFFQVRGPRRAVSAGGGMGLMYWIAGGADIPPCGTVKKPGQALLSSESVGGQAMDRTR